MKPSACLFATILSMQAPVQARAAARPPAGPNAAAERQALDLARRAIGYRSVRGPGNRTKALAEHFKAEMVAGGFPAADIEVTPVDDTAYFISRWRGGDPAAKPLVVSGHLDVVEARREDWKRDPFTAEVANGYLYGHGATDMKLDAAIVVAALTELRRRGYRPRRDIVLEFSGDEETTMKTSAIIAERLKDAELVINIDGGGGLLGEDGRPRFFTWQGAEKTYADFEMSVVNEGGHSSAPRADNAITELSRALGRIGAYRFRPQRNELTRAFFAEAAKQRTGPTAAAMRAFAGGAEDAATLDLLVADPVLVGQIGTTCVATMISGGHAINALAQRATANVNCRIFPGVQPAAVMAELKRVAAEPTVAFRDVTEGAVPNDASPMRPDFVRAVETAMAKAYPGVPVIPAMSPGASDSMWFRYHKVPSYAASPVFIKGSDNYSHGLDERTPVASIGPAITYYLSLFTDLSR